MKTFFFAVLLLVTLRDSVVAASENVADDVLSSTSIKRLMQIAARSAQSRQRARGCEIQKARGAPPTLCYSAKASDQKDLDRLDFECVQRSKTATQLPSSDDLTSITCKAAIETRKKDLEYAQQRAASR